MARPPAFLHLLSSILHPRFSRVALVPFVFPWCLAPAASSRTIAGMTKRPSLRLLTSVLCLLTSPLFGVVRPGIDVLEGNGFKELRGKRVALVVNPASVDSHLVPTVDVLRNAPGVKLTALLGPEHGVYGDEYAGSTVKDKKDARTGVTAFSLYGKTRKPTTQMAATFDAIVFDFHCVHGAPGNVGTSRRRAFSARYVGDDVTFLERPGRTSPPFPGIGQQSGERLREDWFPVAWRA